MIRLSIEKPVAVTSAVILVLMFGLLSLLRVPIQLTPDIVKPEITVETRWPGSSPHEIEREIVEEQETELQGVEGLERMTSESVMGVGTIVLRFPPGTDMNAALLRVANRLEQVREYPEDAEKPMIFTSNRTDNAMAWFILKREAGNDTPIDEYYELCDDQVQPFFERVEGVGSSNIFGGREAELQVILKPEALAARSLTVSAVLQAIERENSNWSGGRFDEGKRTYFVRTIGEYSRPRDVENVVLGTSEGRRVYVRDVAEVRLGRKKRDNFVRQRGEESIAINCVRKTGANVLDVMARLKAAAGELNRSHLAVRRLRLFQVYDETEYINDSVDLVLQSLITGSILATLILFAFLWSWTSTVIIALSIPISIIGSFILMYLMGRTINVVSLAGMSFASGMVVDNSIVSLENIFRHRQEGKGPLEAALDGAREVWGSILASSLTTIAVFVPVLFLQDQASQLFRDIALAISCSIGLSLLVSITVVPAMAARFFRRKSAVPSPVRTWSFDRVRDLFGAGVAAVDRSVWRRLAVAAAATGVSLGLTYALLPDAEYLPEGNRNLAIGFILPPPGYSLDEIARMGKQVESLLAPHLGADPLIGEAPAALAGGAQAEASSGSGAGAKIRNLFFVAREKRIFMGATAWDGRKAGQLVPILQQALGEIPGVIAVAQQASLFQRGIGAGRSVDVEISGPQVEELVAIGGRIFARMLETFPVSQGNQARPIPSLDLQNPEVHVIPDRERARDLGLDASEVGVAVDAILDGIKADDYKLEGREIDLTVMGRDPEAPWRTQDLREIPIHTPEGRLVPLESVAEVKVTRGPEQLNHIERQRAITVQLVPARTVPIERAVQTIDDEILKPLGASGALGSQYHIRLAGTADDLSKALQAFRWNFVLAVIITYLLMAALFESFVYPFVVMFSVPLGAVGGVLCFVLVDRFIAPVSFDVLAMLGFVILVGTVVNNAILIVDWTLQRMRRGVPRGEAIVESVRSRIRPIFMTSLTSVFGMVPLVVAPGSGSELYRGLGSIVLGGLAVSTLFTIFVVPAILGIVIEIRERLGWRTA